MNHLKKILCLGLAGLFVLSLASCTKQTGMAEPKAVPANLSIPEERERKTMAGDIFVATNGDDKNSGTKDAPVKTLERALELARALSKEEKVTPLKTARSMATVITV